MSKPNFRWMIVSLLFCGAILLVGVRLNQAPVSPLWKVEVHPYVKAALAFSADGSTLIGVRSGGISRWRASDGSSRGQTGLRLSSDSTLSSDGSVVAGFIRKPSKYRPLPIIEVCDARSGIVMRRWPVSSRSPHKLEDASVLLSPDHSRICTFIVYKEGFAYQNSGYWERSLWDTNSGRLVQRWSGKFNNTQQMNAAILSRYKYVFSPRDQRLYEYRAEYDKNDQATGALELRDALTGRSIILPVPNYRKFANLIIWSAATFSRDGRYVAACLPRGTICVWDVQTRKLLWNHYEPNVAHGQLLFSPDSRKLARSGVDSTFQTLEISRRARVLIYDVATGNRILRPTEETPLDVMKLTHIERVTPKERVFYSHQPRTIMPPIEDGYVNALAWSPDSQTIAVDYSYGEIKLWRVP